MQNCLSRKPSLSLPASCLSFSEYFQPLPCCISSVLYTGKVGCLFLQILPNTVSPLQEAWLLIRWEAREGQKELIENDTIFEG